MDTSNSEEKIWEQQLKKSFDEIVDAAVGISCALQSMPPREKMTTQEEQMFVSGVILLKSIGNFYLWYERWRQST